MKHLLTTLILLSALSITNAQVKIGFTAGVNKTDGFDRNSDFLQLNPKTTYNLGIGLDMKILNRLSFEPILLYSNKGWILENNLDEEFDRSLQYISAQLLGKIHLTKNLKIILGPEFGYLVSAAADGNTESQLELFSAGEVGAVAGVEFSFLKRFAVHAKYNLGLSDVLNVNLTDEIGNPIGTTSIKNRTIMVGATIYPFKIEVN